MADTKEFKILRTAFNANLRRVSGHVAAARLFMESGDLSRAYYEAEKIQYAGFDAKDLLGKLVVKNGG